MLDFRKSFLAAALLALGAGTASAQGPLSCVAQSAGTPSIRAEGVAELVGDVIVTCTGGNPTPANRALPQLNIQVFTQPSINITSRILTAGGDRIEFTEALLFIDEPTPANQRPCGSAGYPHSITPATTQTIIAGVCGAHAGSPTSNGIGTYDPTVSAPTLSDSNVNYVTYRGNAYQARRNGNNSQIWQGVPFDPPGSLTTRVLRLTNVRVNASQLGVPAGSVAAVALLVSTSASGVFPGPLGGGPIALPITNPNPTVAVAQASLDFSVVDPQTCLQCENANNDFAGNGTSNLTTKGVTCDSVLSVLRFTERFPTVFRRRGNRLPLGDPDPRVAPIPAPPNTADAAQDILGTIYQTETGFYKWTPTANWPQILQNGTVATGSTDGSLGLADHGTRLIARFTNVQNGLQVWVQNTSAINTLQGGALNTGIRTGTVTLTNSDANGAGAFTALGSAGVGVAGGITQVSIVGGTGQAVWEVANADTTAIERVNISVVIAYRANTANNLPTLGTSSVSGSLAPLSTVATASTSAPLPRFVDTATARTLLTINSCRTNILFPFVSNQAGFDTGLAIANTSKDPFGTSIQTGACSVNFYGFIGTSKVCLKYPSPSITGGEHFVWALSSGGAVTATAGFQGYVIAQCEFQYGHGFAFISDLGAQRLAMGYLALIIDEGIPSRSRSRSETLGH